MSKPIPRPRRARALREQTGASLVEVLIALVILSIGILAISQVFPAGTRTQVQNRMRSSANYFAQQKLEELRSLPWDDAQLSVGRHPNATDFDSLGASRAWLRAYNVTVLPSPLDNLKRVAVQVQWTYIGTRSMSDTIYLRR